MSGWSYLLLAGLFEIGFTTLLKQTEEFTRLWPSLLFLLFAFASFALLQKSLESIPLGTAYAVWTGIGATGTAVVGMLIYNDPVSFWRIFFLVTLVASVIGLKYVSPH